MKKELIELIETVEDEKLIRAVYYYLLNLKEQVS